MKDVKVSVVMPCLNAAAYIGKAIESVLGQTLKELELIIVDAGSTDGSLEIIEEYQNKDDRIHLLMSEKKSMGYQYNKGIQSAKGKYVGFVESDDFIHFQMYERLYETAEENQIDYVKSDFDLFMGEEENRVALNYSILTTFHKKLYNTVFNPQNEAWILFHDTNMWNGIYNREFLLVNQIALNETPGAAFQDMGFVFQTFISARKVMYVQNPSYYYRRDNENASQYNKIRHMKFTMDELTYIWRYMNQHKITIPFREYIFHRCLIQFSQIYGFYLCEDIPIEKQIDVDNYLDILKDYYESLDYLEIRDKDLDQLPEIYALRLGKEKFETVVKCNYQSDKQMKRMFFDFIKNHKFIIFGLGEQGKALLMLCYKHHIEDNVIGLCDNSTAIRGEILFGKICKTPDEYIRPNLEVLKDVYYVVANVSNYEEIKKQLVEMGIERERIIHCIGWVQTHNVLEMEKENI